MQRPSVEGSQSSQQTILPIPILNLPWKYFLVMQAFSRSFISENAPFSLIRQNKESDSDSCQENVFTEIRDPLEMAQRGDIDHRAPTLLPPPSPPKKKSC